jgi:hypothetical protein
LWISTDFPSQTLAVWPEENLDREKFSFGVFRRLLFSIFGEEDRGGGEGERS